MARKARTERTAPRAGLWSTVDGAVQSGWPATLRLVVILVSVALLAASARMLADGLDLNGVLRAITTGL